MTGSEESTLSPYMEERKCEAGPGAAVAMAWMWFRSVAGLAAGFDLRIPLQDLNMANGVNSAMESERAAWELRVLRADKKVIELCFPGSQECSLLAW
jgi:hypothetical protein